MSLLQIKGWKLPLLALVGFCFALSSVLGKPKEPDSTPAILPPATSYANTIAGIGVVEPKSETVALGTDLSGIIRRVDVRVGEYVEKGAPIFSLDTREVEANIKTLKAALESARIQSADAAAQYGIVQRIKDKRAVARDEVNQRKFARQHAAARVKEITAQLDEAKTTCDRLTIRAPIDGHILELNVRAGEYASAGVLAAPLVRMGDISTLHVRVEIDEEHASQIKPESPATGTPRGSNATKIPLEFVRFEPFVKPKQNLAVAGQRVDTRVLQAIYALPEGHEGLFVGQQMDVFIEKQSATETNVPAAAQTPNAAPNEAPQEAKP